jgi:hypothetical protein
MNIDYAGAEKYVLTKLGNELSKSFCYHNVKHTQEVIAAAEEFALQEGLNAFQLVNVKTAALCHDTGFLYRKENNELFGARLAGEILPIYGYNSTQVKEIINMILATTWPQRPANLYEEILCDADLSYLGTDSAASGSSRLRRELSLNGRTFTDAEWLKLEISFLTQHHYFTRSAKLSRGPGLEKYFQDLLQKQRIIQQYGERT